MTAGLMISSIDAPLTVGQKAIITCSTDLAVSTIEWQFNDMVIATGMTDELSLTFDPVNDSLHNKEYLCRVAGPYGHQEDRITVTVAGMMYTLEMKY